MPDDELIERGRRIVESGKYAPPQGEYLGRIEAWGLDVHQGSPQAWQDALHEQDAEPEQSNVVPFPTHRTRPNQQ